MGPDWDVRFLSRREPAKSGTRRSPRLPKAKVEKKARVSFDLEDLRKIFNAPVFREQERPIAGAGEAAYWRPLIALYAGARLTEIGQLRVQDIKRESGIDYFDISDEGEDAGIKMLSSRRRVPIHAELVSRYTRTTLPYFGKVTW